MTRHFDYTSLALMHGTAAAVDAAIALDRDTNSLRALGVDPPEWWGDMKPEDRSAIIRAVAESGSIPK